MFLPKGHRYRFDTSRQTFNGKQENRLAPRKLEGAEIEQLVSMIGQKSSNSKTLAKEKKLKRIQAEKGK